MHRLHPAAGTDIEELTMSMHELAKLAVRAVVIGGAALAVIVPSAGARPISDGPMQAPGASASVQRHEPRPAPAPQLSRLIRGDLGGTDRTVAADQTQAHDTSPAASGFDWVTVAIGGAGFAGLLGLIWLGVAAVSRITRPRVAH
jgi:hypothetical protein